MTDLLNLAKVNGMYNNITPMYMETEVTVKMVNLVATKAADHEYWGSGPLTYTVTVTNDETEPYTGITLEDTLEKDKVDFVNGSVKLNGTTLDPAEYSYDNNTGLLTVNVGTVSANDSAAISFRVTKKI